MMNYLLPIGSVIRLAGGEKRLMIYGVKQSDNEGDGKEYDYVAVLYPEGNLGTEYQYMFNHSDIEDVYFRGFEDIERQNFIELISKAYSSNSADEE